MAQLCFTVSFAYEVKELSLRTDLRADIEMADDGSCIVRNIQRLHVAETPLLPVITLKKVDGVWVHTDTGKQSVISGCVGVEIDLYLEQSRGEPKDNISDIL